MRRHPFCGRIILLATMLFATSTPNLAKAELFIIKKSFKSQISIHTLNYSINRKKISCYLDKGRAHVGVTGKRKKQLLEFLEIGGRTAIEKKRIATAKELCLERYQPLQPVQTPTPVPTSNVYQKFVKPYQGESPICSWYDHQYPQEFIHYDGSIVTTSNETIHWGVDGHQGYDFCMPEGTPILASYDGTVEFSGEETPFNCPLLNATVSGKVITISHEIAGVKFRSLYAHFSELNVVAGDTVKAGERIGLSGSTGCSTAPHLHFDISRQLSDDTEFVTVDPFGWNSLAGDPWSSNPVGMQSSTLWEPDHSPDAISYMVVGPNPNPGDRSAVAITRFNYMGINDQVNLNDEFVELTLDTRYSSGETFDLSGYKIKNNLGESYNFPSGTKLRNGKPLLLFSGSPEASNPETETHIFWRRKTPAWNNDGDCARLYGPSFLQYYLYYGNSCIMASEDAPGSGLHLPRELHGRIR